MNDDFKSGSTSALAVISCKILNLRAIRVGLKKAKLNMFRPKYIQLQNMGRVVLKLFITINIRILLLQKMSRKCNLSKYPIRSFDLVSPPCNKISFFLLDIVEPYDRCIQNEDNSH